jgi:iron complex transport system substrate-binding protein
MRRRQFMDRLARAAGLVGLGALACQRRQDSPEDGPRLVSLGGSLTELVFALGAGDQLVGADSSSYYPSATAELAKVGYQRSVSAEGVIGLGPSVVLHTDASGPPAALEQIRAAGIETAEFPEPRQLDQARARIVALADRLGRVPMGDELVAAFDVEIAQIHARRSRFERSPKVMFLYTRGADVLMVAGKSTAAATMIEAAGGQLAFEHTDFVRLSAEAVIAAEPEVILVTERGLASLGGSRGLLEQRGLAETPAGRDQRIVAFDDLALLGLGPRTGVTLLDLSRALHPEQA